VWKKDNNTQFLGASCSSDNILASRINIDALHINGVFRLYGDLIQLGSDAIFIEGQEPRTVLLDQDIPSVLVYRSGDDLYVFDTGATAFFRKRLLEAIEKLRPFSRFIILNSHSHVDHTANNGIIGEVEADEKLHFLSKVGIPELDYEGSIIRSYEEINKYYYFTKGPRFPYSLATRPLGLARHINRRAPFFIIKKTIQGFAPLEPSSETVRPYEDNELTSLVLGPVSWSGWNISDQVWALKTNGHSPDSVSFLLPEEKLLFLGDETLMYFNCWLDSSAANVRDALGLAIRLIESGTVETVIGGHQQKPYSGAEAIDLLRRLLDGHEIVERETLLVVDSAPDGATIAQIYRQLSKRKKRVPVLDAFFKYEYPKMPIFLKTQIAGILIENGYAVEGPEGNRRFIKS
jgi:glyoxylase-like metal-dependent hydrolase (beta-lactamase superfamily II)